VYLPWNLDGAAQAMVWPFVAAYGALAVVLLLLSFGGGAPERALPKG
jgi:AGZA family xanthine/uracil permease-like MFS transporter